jgi:hypothetical protein
VDEVDETMKPERKVVNEMNSQIGIHVKREVFGYSNPKIDDVVFHDYVFTNNGIVRKDGTTVAVTLYDVYFVFVDRLAFAGEGNPGRIMNRALLTGNPPGAIVTFFIILIPIKCWIQVIPI